MTVRRPLDARILAAFKQACAEGRLDVADHLLRALEMLDGEPEPGTPLGEAYLWVAGSGKGRKRTRQAH